MQTKQVWPLAHAPFLFLCFLLFLALPESSKADVLAENWHYKTYSSLNEAEKSTWTLVPKGGPKIPYEYQGFIEYRAEFTLNPEVTSKSIGVFLGRIGDVDKVYVNDTLIGQTGEFPPFYVNQMDIVREYLIPKEALKINQANELRVVTYVEYVAAKGLNISHVNIGAHDHLQHLKYVEDLKWYFSRALIPVLCLLLGALSLPWLSPKRARFQQFLIFGMGITYFIFGICRSRIIFHFLGNLLSYRFTAMSSVLGMALICCFGLFLAAASTKKRFKYAGYGYLIVILPVLYFWTRVLFLEDLITTAVLLKQWFIVETVMIWTVTGIVWWYTGRLARWLKLGFLILAILVTNDVLRDLFIIKSIALMDIGFNIFIVLVIMSQVVSLRLSWEHLVIREIEQETEIKLGKMTAQINHDIRTPISTISTLIEQARIDPETKSKIQSSLGRVRELTAKNLKQLTSNNDPSVTNGNAQNSTSENMPQKSVPSCSVGGVTQTCISDLKATKSYENIDFICDIPKKSLSTFVAISFSDLSRVLTNVIVNAIEASSSNNSNKVYISVNVADDSKCMIVVKDYGKGFEPTVLAALSKGARATTKSNGNGLGLRGSQDLLRASDGKLTIGTNKSGSTIAIDLPKISAPKWFFNISNTSAREFVCLDDDVGICERISRAIPEANIILAQTEEDLLQKAKSNPSALLLIDYNFGGPKTGLELIQQGALKDRAVLVSGQISFDEQILRIAESQNIRMFPKECL